MRRPIVTCRMTPACSRRVTAWFTASQLRWSVSDAVLIVKTGRRGSSESRADAALCPSVSLNVLLQVPYQFDTVSACDDAWLTNCWIEHSTSRAS